MDDFRCGLFSIIFCRVIKLMEIIFIERSNPLITILIGLSCLCRNLDLLWSLDRDWTNSIL